VLSCPNRQSHREPVIFAIDREIDVKDCGFENVFILTKILLVSVACPRAVGEQEQILTILSDSGSLDPSVRK
jgi:hypothetical protein